MVRDDRGRSVRRLEDERFLTGRGRYVDDFTLPGEVHAYVLRSPRANAVIERIDIGGARDVGGVLGVFTEADLAAEGIGPLPCVAHVSTVDPMIVPPRYALARGRVRHVGDPVALIVAESHDLARDAAERITVEYRPLEAVVDGFAALLPGRTEDLGRGPRKPLLSISAGRPGRGRSGLRRRSLRRRDGTPQQPRRPGADRAAVGDRHL
jgi:aerobic carbon-monoxide dehydrogenase large subunit